VADRITNGPFAFHTDIWPGVAKLMEECGETVQVLAKLVMIGGGRDHFDGTDLYVRIEEELADLQAAISFVLFYNGENGNLDLERMIERISAKRDLFMKWHAEGEE
jgi:NTP pyrophosphatase (non-canonical NTP hydrolase)